MSYIRPNSVYEPCYPGAHNRAFTDDPLDPVYQYASYMGGIETRNFDSEYVMSKLQHENPKSLKNRRKQVAIASVLFILFFLAVVATCILFIYFLVSEEGIIIGTKVPPLTDIILVDAQLTLEQQFLTQYDDPNSQEYQELEMKFIKVMDEIILASNYSLAYIGTAVVYFRNGSTIVGFNLNFNDIPPHLDKDAGSEELSSEIQRDISHVISDAVYDKNSTIKSDLNVKDQSVMVNEVHIDIQPVTMANTFTSKAAIPTTPSVFRTTKLNGAMSTLTTTISETESTRSSKTEFLSTFFKTPLKVSSTKPQIVSTMPQAELMTAETMTTGSRITTASSEIQETTETTTAYSQTALQFTSTPTRTLTSMQRTITNSLDKQTTVVDTAIVNELTSELTEGQTTVSGTTNTQEEIQPTTIFKEILDKTTIQTTEILTTEQPTEQFATQQFSIEHLSTEKITTEQLTTQEYTTMHATEQDTTSLLEELTKFPTNSSAAIHIHGSMLLNESFPESLNNRNSTDYISLAGAIGIGIDCSLVHSNLRPVYAGNDITQFKPGSIIAMFTIYISSAPSGFNRSASLSEYLINSIEDIIKESINDGIFGNLNIIEDSVTMYEVHNSEDVTYKCQNITSDCCKNLPYQTTSFPNSFANSPEEAEEILHVLNGSCHTNTALYLCSLVYPHCPSLDAQMLLPCESFCDNFVTVFNSETLLELESETGSQISNCTYLNKPSHEQPCFTFEGRILTRSPAAFNQEICSTQPLHPPASARVVGGQDAALGEWPWMISLQRFTSHKCGAVLISPQYALTAAHCLGLFNTLELGTVFLSSTVSPGEQRIEVEETFAYPEYDPLTLVNDIAIIKLKEQVEYTDYVRPVCVSTNASQFQVNQQCYITGWGDTTGNGKLPDTLQEVSLPLVDINTCASRYTAYGVTIDENVVCAGYPEGGKDACQGDSGGSLVCQDSSGIWQLYGLVSNGVGCALPNQPGIYTRVPAYLDFINLVLDGGTPKYRSCNQNEFQCSHGTCINKDWQCDGHNDCRDNSDELNCGCSDVEFTCTIGDCVLESWVCDGDYDCLDGSDEEGCGCLANQFDCGDGVCIVVSYYCDTYPDCRNGADELNCPDSITEVPGLCSENTFMCNDGSCIEGSYKCDNDPDCQDGSDEADCLQMTEEPIVSPQCYNITSVVCGDILISHKALFPNTYANNPRQAEELLNEFIREESCHQDSMRLICALVYQGCEDDDEAPVHPCDAMCEDVLSTCSQSFLTVTQNNNLFEISCLALPDTNCLSAPGYCSGFLCSNNHCIQSSYYCDDYDDCSDLSDESSCQNTDLPSYLCHPINVTSCASYLPYTYAAFPNAYAQSVELADQVINRLLSCASCHDNMMSLVCNLLFPECDGYEYEPCINHCIDVISSCQDAFVTLQLELNFTKPITCEDLPVTRCLAGGGMCEQEDFQCTDGKCIPFELTCEGHADCLDNTDESNCSCTDVQYTCSDTGICLGYYEVCDGIENCVNGEDEALCANGCPGGFFRCANETYCIPQSYVCDEVGDCKQRNDENDCDFCGEFEFRCKDDGYCLPNYYVCDGSDHCFDGSDELECGI